MPGALGAQARPEFKLGRDNVSAEFLAKNPQGKVPLLETPHGACARTLLFRFPARRGRVDAHRPDDDACVTCLFPLLSHSSAPSSSALRIAPRLAQA
jgi:hypothetical protein